MSRNTKIVIAILVVLAFFVALMGYWATMRRAKQTATAIATVVSAEKETKSGSRGTDNTIVTLSYRAGATMAQARARVSGVRLEDYPAGRTVRVCYDPANVSSLRIDDAPCS